MARVSTNSAERPFFMPYKRNNPGNFRPGVDWKGSTPDGPFLKFDTLENGFRAIYLDIRAKRKKGVKKLTDYFRIYAPEADNNQPDKYAEFVAGKIGHKNLPNENDVTGLVGMALAIGQMEHGQRPTANDLAAAIRGRELAAGKNQTEKIEPNFLPSLFLGSILAWIGAKFIFNK